MIKKVWREGREIKRNGWGVDDRERQKREKGVRKEKGRKRRGGSQARGRRGKRVEKREAAERNMPSQNIEMSHFVLKFLERGNYTETSTLQHSC